MKDINFGIIGMGTRGKFMFDLIQKYEGTQVVAVCDNSPARLAEYRLSNSSGNDGKTAITAYPDYQSLIADKRVDAIYISSMDSTHGEILIAALKAGIHTICEKPLEITEEKISAILTQAKESNCVVALGYVLRYAPLFKKVKEIVAQGIIGRIVNVHAIDSISYGGYAFFHDWHRRKENITSLLLQKASHSLDVITWLVDSRPVAVASFGGLDTFGEAGAYRELGGKAPETLRCGECDKKRSCPESILNRDRVKGINWQNNWPDSCVYNSEIDVDDNEVIIIKYQNNVKVSYCLNEFSPDYKRQYTLVGDKGQLEFDDVSNVITVTFRDSKNRLTYTVNTLNIHSGGDEGLLEDFVECCKSGERPVASLEQGAISALLALNAQKSIDEERIVRVQYDF